jgi:hypothetical protein
MLGAIYLYPLHGTFDVDEVRRVVEVQPNVLLDPCGSGKYMICPDYDGHPSRRIHGKDRIADPTRFPYVGLITVAAERVRVFQEHHDDAQRATSGK